VFYRMNAQSRVFESVFSQERVPYTVIGGFRFYEREEVKDMLAYLRLLINPLDGVSLRRVVNKPPRGIGAKTLAALTAGSVDRGRPFYDFHADIPAPRRRRVEEFLELLRGAMDMLDSTPPPEVLRYLYDATGYVHWLRSEGKEEKIGNLNELFNAVEEFSRSRPGAPVTEFIEEASLNQGAREEDFQDGRVHLITLHNAKGLEFPVVFMAGLEEGVFPHHLSGDRPGDLHEERRLCYVGMTRAKERLYLTAARTRKLYGRSVEREVSPFLAEIPRHLLEVRTPLDSRGPLPRSSFTKRQGEITVGKGIRERMSEEQIAAVGAGTRVVHRQFGCGTVAAVNRGVAEIDFDDGNRMKFMLKYTPLALEESAP
jgi:DNA helicase-2/ATP-dependent DNA helicase PcrA